MTRFALRHVLQYGAAVVAAELAAVPWLLAGKWIDPSATVLFLAATLASTYFGGLGPGLVTIVLGYVAAAHYFASPTGSAPNDNVRYGLETAVWLIGALAVMQYRSFLRTRESEKRAESLRVFENAVQGVGAAIASVGADGRVVSWNPAAAELFGWSADEVVGKELPTIPQEQQDADMFLTAFHSVLGGGRIDGKDVIQVRKDRTFMQTRFAGSPILDEGGLVVGMVCVWDDVTTRRKLESTLRHSAHEFKTIIQEMQVGVLVVGPRADVLACNLTTLRVLGLSERQLLGTSMYGAAWAFMREDGTRYPAENYPILEVLTTGKPIEGVVMGVFRPRTNDTVWLLVHAHAILADNGTISNVLCTLTDITQYRSIRAKSLPADTAFLQRPST